MATPHTNKTRDSEFGVLFDLFKKTERTKAEEGALYDSMLRLPKHNCRCVVKKGNK